MHVEGDDTPEGGRCSLGPDSELPGPRQDGTQPEEYTDEPGCIHQKTEGHETASLPGNPRNEGLSSGMRLEDSGVGAETGDTAKTAEDISGLESTPDDSDPKSKPSSECEDAYFSDDTSELSEEEKLAFELRRAEIRRGKARETSPVPSEAVPLVTVSDTLIDELRGYARNEAPSPVAGPAQDSRGDADMVFISWEKDPERPLQKLPIRFRDLNGRTYLLPWKAVKTWNVRAHVSP